MNLIELDDLRTKPPHLLRPRARNALEQREAREGYSTEEGLLASLSKAVSRERLPSKAARKLGLKSVSQNGQRETHSIFLVEARPLPSNREGFENDYLD